MTLGFSFRAPLRIFAVSHVIDLLPGEGTSLRSDTAWGRSELTRSVGTGLQAAWGRIIRVGRPLHQRIFAPARDHTGLVTQPDLQESIVLPAPEVHRCCTFKLEVHDCRVFESQLWRGFLVTKLTVFPILKASVRNYVRTHLLNPHAQINCRVFFPPSNLIQLDPAKATSRFGQVDPKRFTAELHALQESRAIDDTISVEVRINTHESAHRLFTQWLVVDLLLSRLTPARRKILCFCRGANCKGRTKQP